MEYRIEAGDRAAVVVEVGGALRTFEVAGQEITDGYGPGEIAPSGAGQILAPWPNRIRDGRYTWAGQTYQLAQSEPAYANAIHGLVRWVPWRVADRAPDAVSFSYVSPAQPGYPWELELTTTWSVGPEGLRARHTATNRSGTPAPFGLGAHPYVRLPGVAVDDVVLTVPGERLLVVDGRKLPIGARPVAGTKLDFRTGRRGGATLLDPRVGPVSRGSAGRPATLERTPPGPGWPARAVPWWPAVT